MSDCTNGKVIVIVDTILQLSNLILTPPFHRVGTTEIHTANVILLEGILVLYPQSIRQLCNMMVYIDVDSDDRLARRGNYLSNLSR
jgi:hypothetical protein